MSATLAGAIKARIESGGLGLAVYRDGPPPNAPLPYAVVTEGITRTPEPTGDNGSATTQLEEREEVQLDLWQALVNTATGVRVEDPDLARKVVRRLHMRPLENVGTGRVYPVRVTASRRLPTREKNLVRDTISIVSIRQIGVPL